MQRLWGHIRGLWPKWAFLPPLPFVALAIFDLARHELRWEHIALLVLVPLLAYTHARTKKLLVGIYPIGLVGVFYDVMRLVKNMGVRPDTVHDCDLRDIEMHLFGFSSGGEKLTVQDWFQAHPSTALDLYCAIPYGTFIYVSLGFAIFLYIRDFGALKRYTWSFLALNVMGFATYHIYPAAPPWYFHAHGCAIDLLAKASEGPNLARVDALLGVPYFHAFYGRASDVFGAVPSLHVAYPFLIVLEGWRHFRSVLRILSVWFFASMLLAAPYLDHHWIVDEIVGVVYCLAVFWAARRLQRLLSGAPSTSVECENPS
jgi:hypothetical protein